MTTACNLRLQAEALTQVGFLVSAEAPGQCPLLIQADEREQGGKQRGRVDQQHSESFDAPCAYSALVGKWGWVRGPYAERWPGYGSELVGRARETALIADLINRAMAGCGEVLALVGDNMSEPDLAELRFDPAAA
jgi:hypothetical protein